MVCKWKTTTTGFIGSFRAILLPFELEYKLNILTDLYTTPLARIDAVDNSPRCKPHKTPAQNMWLISCHCREIIRTRTLLSKSHRELRLSRTDSKVKPCRKAVQADLTYIVLIEHICLLAE
jgi:hypothetical protein